jgi:UDP-N-acetylmuramyl pentapeptide synthase
VDQASSISFSHWPETVKNLDELVAQFKRNLPAQTVILVKGSRSMKMEGIVEKILVS